MDFPCAFIFLFVAALLVAHSNSGPIDSLSQSVIRLLALTGKPADISLMFCNKTVEMNLLRNLTSGESEDVKFFGGKLQPSRSLLGGQETSFIILDVQCPNAEIVRAFQASHYSVVYSRWLLVDSGNKLGALDEGVLQPMLTDTDLSQCSEVFYFKESTDELRLKQVYKRWKVNDTKVVLENFGSFYDPQNSAETFQDLRDIKVTAIRRRDLKGSIFEVAITIADPDTLNHLTDFVNPEVDPLTKNGLRLGLLVLEQLNCQPQLVVARGWGQANPAANNWTGMLGDMKAGKAEFAGSPTLVRGSRLEAVDYLSYSVQTWSRIVFRAPKLSYTTNVFLLPFDKFVWIGALFLITLVVALLLVSTWSEWNVLVPANALEPSRDMLAPQISDVIFLVLGNVCTQGSPATPRSTAGRIIIIFCLIFIVCLYVSYCAFIVALLQSPASNIKTTSQLLNSHIPVGNQDTDYFRFWMSKLTDPVERQLYEKRILNNKDGTDNFMDLDEGVRRMQKGLFALHMETPIGYRLVSNYFNEAEKCDLREIPFADFRSPYFVTRKHSPFKELLRILTIRIKENGAQNKLWKEVYVSKPKCTQQGNFIPLALMDVSPVIFAYLGGIGLSLCVFLMELVMHKYFNGNTGMSQKK